MRLHVTELGVALDEPPGWHIRDWRVRDARVVALVPEEQRGVAAESLHNVLGVCTPRERRDTLLETAEVTMRVYVQQGSPEYVLDRWRDGRPAHRYEWTDGIRVIHTWFVQVREHLVEIDVDVHFFDPNGDQRSPYKRLSNVESVLLPCVMLDDEAAPVP